jgi:hypothetical protein
MTYRKLIISGFVAAGLLGSASAGFAEDKPAMTPAIAEQLDLASTLTNYAIARNDPLLMLAAARILKGVAAEGVAATPAMSPDDLVAKAKEVAGADSELGAIADDIAAEGGRGLCYGSGTYYGCF